MPTRTWFETRAYNSPSTARAVMDANSRHLTRAPKGVFFYSSHEEMTRDRERWTVKAIAATERARRRERG